MNLMRDSNDSCAAPFACPPDVVPCEGRTVVTPALGACPVAHFAKGGCCRVPSIPACQRLAGLLCHFSVFSVASSPTRPALWRDSFKLPVKCEEFNIFLPGSVRIRALICGSWDCFDSSSVRFA